MAAGRDVGGGESASSSCGLCSGRTAGYGVGVFLLWCTSTGSDVRTGFLLFLGSCAVAPVSSEQPDADEPARCEQPCEVLERVSRGPCGAGLDPAAPEWPEKLSDLGCFTSVVPLEPHPGLVPYDVAAPLHSDGATKGRWFVLPDDAAITWTDEGPWDFPVGALLLKSFGMVVTGGERLLEIRAMLRGPEQWHYAGWRIGPDEQEGWLAGTQGDTELLSVVDTVDGLQRIEWWYPGVDGCVTCHRDLSVELLGPTSAQLDLDVVYDGPLAPQVDVLAGAGLLTGVPEVRDGVLLADPYGDAPVAQRARAWLHAQCAHCHQPNGFTFEGATLDLRYDTPLQAMDACEVGSASTSWNRHDILLRPGDAEGSLLLQRIEVPGLDRMPPGAQRLDHEGVAAVRAWINGLQSCP